MNRDKDLNLKKVVAQHVHIKYWKDQLAEFVQPDKQIEFLQILNQYSSSDYYKKVALKWFISSIENQSIELDGEIAAEYACLMMTQAASTTTAIAEVQYLFGKEGSIKIRETPWVISQRGSTGHRTWEAALALGDYLIQSGFGLYSNKDIVELGAGSGFVGILIAKLLKMSQCGENKVILTDGDEEVVEECNQNIQLNQVQDVASVRQLYWGYDLPGVCDAPSGRILVCADVTYDSDIITDLVVCLDQFLSMADTSFALLAATMRNLTTFATFEQECQVRSIDMSCVETYKSPFGSVEFFIPPENPDICIYKLTKR